jgi:predicted AlkP superfamily pyrophosphatase or phosphodiesterase
MWYINCAKTQMMRAPAIYLLSESSFIQIITVLNQCTQFSTMFMNYRKLAAFWMKFRNRISYLKFLSNCGHNIWNTLGDVLFGYEILGFHEKKIFVPQNFSFCNLIPTLVFKSLALLLIGLQWSGNSLKSFILWGGVAGVDVLGKRIIYSNTVIEYDES